MTVRVVLVDDDDLMRAGLRALLSIDDEIAVVGEAADGRAAVATAAALRPDVVLMDLRMAGGDGIAATREVTATVPETRVLVLTTFEDDASIFGALRAGASGFLLKRTRPEQLVAGIHAVAAGDSLLSPSVTRRVIDRMAAGEREAPAHAGTDLGRRVATLTAREREVLALVAAGRSNGEIAAELVVEESTVKSHVKRILMKLDARDRVQAVIAAYDSGLARASPAG